MDVKSVFLNDVLEEEMYIEQSLGNTKSEKEHKMLIMKKALYGLKQASRA
jgi:Reverse transcriptase (RNA-dependent DNA polymerase)